MRETALPRLWFVVAISMRDAGLRAWSACSVDCSASWFFGCVFSLFSHAFSGFCAGCLICSALPWVVELLGLGFHAGSDSVAVWVLG